MAGRWLTLRRRDDASHQVKLALINVGRLHRHRQRAHPDAKFAGHTGLQRGELDEIRIALRTEVDGVRVDGELQLTVDEPEVEQANAWDVAGVG